MKITETDASLKRKCKEVTEDMSFWCQEFKEYVQNKKCMSLTASQVGKRHRIIAVKNRSRKKVFILVNPSIVHQSKKLVDSEERTLSKNAARTLHKQRPIWVTIQYMTPDLKKTKSKTFWNRQAAAALHAMDIIDGQL